MHHRKDISELKERLEKTDNEKHRKGIEEEIRYQENMIHSLDFMNGNEKNLRSFIQYFNDLIHQAVEALKNRYPNDALSFLENAHHELEKMMEILNEQKSIEKYLLKLNRKVFIALEKEKDP